MSYTVCYDHSIHYNHVRYGRMENWLTFTTHIFVSESIISDLKQKCIYHINIPSSYLLYGIFCCWDGQTFSVWRCNLLEPDALQCYMIHVNYAILTSLNTVTKGTGKQDQSEKWLSLEDMIIILVTYLPGQHYPLKPLQHIGVVLISVSWS